MEIDNKFNVWPSFVDLSISFVVILTLLLMAVISKTSVEKQKAEKISVHQEKIRQEAEELLRLSISNADSTILNFQLDSTKTLLMVSFNKQNEILFNTAGIEYSNQVAAKKSIIVLEDFLIQLLNTNANIVGKIIVEGHTDNRKINRSLKSVFMSNWELSAARAGKVVRELLGDENEKPLGVMYFNYFRATGYASTLPTLKGIDFDRRISIKITTSTSEKLSEIFSISEAI